MIGGTLAHYRILDKLGEGGMGIVYLAEDQRLKRKVALKMLPPSLANDPHRLARFEREVKTVAALNHPNIVTIYSVEEADGYRFFTMEHVEGRTLSQLIPPGGLPLREFLRIAVPLADALAAAHARGVTHRDIKPGNVMVSSEGRVKVLDFGLAKLREHEATEMLGVQPETTLTQEGLAVGTLAYMAPEQLRMMSADHRSDIFSLGVVLFEMATGRCPFLGQSTAEVISSILRDQPARIYERNESVPPALDQVLRRCLEKDPAKRLASAAELRDTLGAIARDVSAGRTASLMARTLPRMQRGLRQIHPWTLAAAAAVVLLLSGYVLARLRPAPAPEGGTVAAATATPGVALLPLTNFSGEPEYFVDGMTDALISALARIEGMRVISRQSAMHYKGSSKLLPEIARELGVAYVVEGSVAREADRVRISAQVVQAEPERTLWSETFERKTDAILSLQNNVAAAIAGAIDVRLTSSERDSMATTKAVDPAAYEAYLQGRYWAEKFSPENFRRAQGYFERSIAIDSTFAPAWAELGRVHQKQGYFFEDLDRRLAKTETALARALELDPASGATHALLGDFHLARWDWPQAEAEILRAIELEPNYAEAHLVHWRLLMRLRRFDEALDAIERARVLDPLSANISANLGFQLGMMQRYEEAFAEFAHALELEPDFVLVHSYSWFFHHKLGKDPERREELGRYFLAQDLAELEPELARRMTSDGYERALHWAALRVDAMAGDPRVKPGFAAGLLACAGEPDRAVRWLERGYAEHDWHMGWLATMPDLESLWERADYQALVAKMKLPRPGS